MSGSTMTTATALSFTPWTLDRTQETPLKDVLARVHRERGHFRDITEASLQEEIAAQGGLEVSSSDDDEEEEQDREATKSTQRKPPTTREELFAARQEMKNYIGAAHQDVLMAQDFISLLESKHAPSQASVSMSPALKRDFGIPPGSLGTDVWDQRAMPVDATRQAQDTMLATRVRMASLQQSADDLLAAATRFQDNVRKETAFWDQILSISERGWNVSKLHKHLLGVRIGFSDASTESVKSVAALYSDGDGNVTLERSIGAKPKAIRATVYREDQMVGCSKLPSLPDQDDMSLDARIRHARDSVYDEELFHEMIRESRSLTSMGVSMKGSKIRVGSGADDSTRVEFELISLDEANHIPVDAGRSSDIVAEAALLLVRLLLGQEHRKKLNQKRTIPAPLNNTKGTVDVQNMTILRSLVLLLRHHSEVSKLNTYLESMSKVIRMMKVSTEVQPARLGLSTVVDGSVNVESLIESMMRPFLSEGVLRIIASEETTLQFKLKIESSVSHISGTVFQLSAPSEQDSNLSSLQQLLEATDEFIAVALAEVLQSTLGQEWELDAREGSLRRASDQESNFSLWFVVNSRANCITLRGNGNGQNEVVWRLTDSGVDKGLNEACEEILG